MSFFRVKPTIISAEQFDGTLACVTHLQDWVSFNDIEDCELGYQGNEAPYALDVTRDDGITTIEAGAWLVCRDNKLIIEEQQDFEDYYEEQAELPL